jgi:hypothetical protein
MKFTTTVALLGLVDARRMVQQAKETCPLMAAYKLLTQDTTCHREGNDEVDDVVFTRKAYESIFNGAVKGWYHSEAAPLGGKCFGPSMEKQAEKAFDIMDKLSAGNIWGVTRADYKSATDDLWDMTLDNMNDCGVYKMIYDYYSWCMENGQTCTFQDNWMNRLYDNMIPLSEDIYYAWNVITQDDRCFSDDQNIKEIGDITESISSLSARVLGFEYKWTNANDFEKITWNQMGENVDHMIANLPVV